MRLTEKDRKKIVGNAAYPRADLQRNQGNRRSVMAASGIETGQNRAGPSEIEEMKCQRRYWIA
jgi:hypothetical protein